MPLTTAVQLQQQLQLWVVVARGKSPALLHSDAEGFTFSSWELRAGTCSRTLTFTCSCFSHTLTYPRCYFFERSICAFGSSEELVPCRTCGLCRMCLTACGTIKTILWQSIPTSWQTSLKVFGLLQYKQLANILYVYPWYKILWYECWYIMTYYIL